MIDVNELITEPILYSATWKSPLASDDQYSLYITHSKIYLCTLHKYNNEYSYNFFSIDAIVSVFYARNSCYNNAYDVVAHLGANNKSLELKFPHNHDGMKMAEEVFVAISKATN